MMDSQGARSRSTPATTTTTTTTTIDKFTTITISIFYSSTSIASV